MSDNKEELLVLASDIASAYFSNNTVDVQNIPNVIHTIYKSLNDLDKADGMMLDRPQPAVPIKKSVTPDYIVCLEDGKKLKMLKRHLKTAYDMSPDDYRERWGLPADYPMVAPNYAQKRSRLAKDIGLGVKGRS